MNDEIAPERMQEQGKYMQQWLQHAPAPPERGTNSYDVFISYRSSDRPWAMALYDALKLAAWEPFSDQYARGQLGDVLGREPAGKLVGRDFVVKSHQGLQMV